MTGSPTQAIEPDQPGQLVINQDGLATHATMAGAWYVPYFARLLTSDQGMVGFRLPSIKAPGNLPSSFA